MSWVSFDSLSHDELELVGQRLCDPLQPRIAVALSGTSRHIRAPLQPLVAALRLRRAEAVALVSKFDCSLEAMREWRILPASSSSLLPSDCRILGELLPFGRVETLQLGGNGFGNVRATRSSNPSPSPNPNTNSSPPHRGPCGFTRKAAATLQLLLMRLTDPRTRRQEGVHLLVRGLRTLPALRAMDLKANQIGDAGVAALAAALDVSVAPALQTLNLTCNDVSDAGMAALARPARSLPLSTLLLDINRVTDTGLEALLRLPVPALRVLMLGQNQLSDVGCAALASAVDGGVLPLLDVVHLAGNSLSEWAQESVEQALQELKASRASRASRWEVRVV